MLHFSRNYRNRAFIIKDFSSNAAKFFANGSLDFIFIDADHGYDAVLSDIKNWGPKIRKGGFIMGHDIDWPPVQKAVTKALKQYQFGPDNVWFVQKQ
jgi:predicted O-methyltransferase YrrM